MSLLEFLKTGDKLNDITYGMSKEELIAKLGQPTEIQEMDGYRYLFFGPFRYGLDDDKIQEMAVEFSRIKTPIVFKNLEYSKFDNKLVEDFILESTSKIHTMMSFVNHLQLNWTAKNNLDKDYLIVQIENGPGIIFDLYDGRVDKISKIHLG